MKGWLGDLREALFGGQTRPPGDYRSKRRWFAQRLLPLIEGPLYAAILRPLARLRDRLERLSPAELTALRDAAQAVLGQDLRLMAFEPSVDPESGREMQHIKLSVGRPIRWASGGEEDCIKALAAERCPSLADAHFSLWLQGPDEPDLA